MDSRTTHSPFSFDPLEQAPTSLKEAVRSPAKNDLERDGVIQRFEYTFELCWKTLRSLLLKAGRSEVSASPKPLIREASVENLISDVDRWFEFLEARNFTVHTYSKKNADQVYEDAKTFPPYVDQLLKAMKSFDKQI